MVKEHHLAAARQWRSEHAAHVARLIATARTAFAPSDQDAGRPELWKAESWKWLAAGESQPLIRQPGILRRMWATVARHA